MAEFINSELEEQLKDNAANGSMSLTTNELRSALKKVLPLAKESYRDSGTGTFIWAEDKLWLVTGSFGSQVAGAVVDRGERQPWLEGQFFNLYALNTFISNPFLGSSVKVTVKDGRIIRFQAGRSYKEINLRQRDHGYKKYIDLPKVETGIEAERFLEWGNIAEFAHASPSHPLNGVHMIVEGGYGHVVATNTYTLAYVWFETPELTRFTCTLPADFLRLAHRTNWKDEKPVLHARNESNKVFVRTSEIFLMGTVLSTDYPAEQVLMMARDVGDRPQVSLPVGELVAALSALSDMRREKTVVSADVVYDETEEGVFFSAAAEGQHGTEFVQGAGGRLDGEVRVNGLAIKSALEMLKTTDIMFINMQIHKHNFLVVKPDDGALFCLGLMAY